MREERRGERIIPCPLCARKTEVPETGVTDLDPAFQIVRLIDIVGPEDDQIPTSVKNLCSIHKEKETEFYCKLCEEPVCFSCISSNGAHHNHENCLLKELIENFKEEIALLQAKLVTQLRSVESLFQELHQHHNKIASAQKSLKELIISDSRNEILTSQRQKLADSTIRSLEQEEIKFKVIKSQLVTCQDFLNNTIDINGSIETTRSLLMKIKDLTASSDSNICGLQGHLSSIFSMDIMHYKGNEYIPMHASIHIMAYELS